MLKAAFIDCETTGTDPSRHGVWQISGMICIEGKSAEPFNFLMSPFLEDEIENEALEIGHVTLAELKDFPDPLTAFRQFEDLLAKHVAKFVREDKYFFIGYKAEFDNQFLRRWFEKCGSQYFGSWFWHPPIDLMTLAALHLIRERETMPNFKLGTVCAKLGIDADAIVLHAGVPVADGLHNAARDIALTRELFNYLVKKTHVIRKPQQAMIPAGVAG